MTGKKHRLTWLEAQQPLQHWYASKLGESILLELNTLLKGILPHVFGYQGLQIGQISQKSRLLESAGLHKKLILGTDAAFSGIDFGADALNLPIASQTMNVVILPHTLDFCQDPHQALREADRVLVNDGHLLVIGFNPYSFWGLRHKMPWGRNHVPWSGEFYSRGRVSDWLSLLNFRILREETFFLRMPISNSTLLNRTQFVEKARPMLGKLGAVYIVHARKQTIPMTVIRRNWRRKAAGVSVGSLVTRMHQRQAKQEKSES